jgi:hypothetical protein
MKTLLILIVLLAQPVLACNQSEALIVAEIAEVTPMANEYCLVQVESFSYFREHALCPLTMEVIENKGLTLEGSDCKKEIGESITGVAISNGNQIILD